MTISAFDPEAWYGTQPEKPCSTCDDLHPWKVILVDDVYKPKCPKCGKDILKN